MADPHYLILGGARSGKTAFAERLATQLGQAPAYLATAEALDAEMHARVASHRQQREGRFITFEEPLELAETIETAAENHDVVLVDCLTLWLSNLLGADREVTTAVEDVLDVVDTIEDSQIIFVSNEVGLGIVPDNPLARTFRDLAGWTHQRLAATCGTAVFVTAGLPMTLKGNLPPLD